jgi:hypothetical protein
MDTSASAPAKRKGEREYVSVSAVLPRDIDPESVYGKFGKFEVEETAKNLLLFFQSRGKWDPFYLKSLMAFSICRGFDPNRVLFGLVGTWHDDSGMFGCMRKAPAYFIQGSDGQFQVTAKFIKKLLAQK